MEEFVVCSLCYAMQICVASVGKALRETVEARRGGFGFSACMARLVAAELVTNRPSGVGQENVANLWNSALYSASLAASSWV